MQLELLHTPADSVEQTPSRRISSAIRTRYIGSKARIADEILEIAGRPNSSGTRFVDLFCGAGSVSRTAASLGWRVHANDHLNSSAMITRAQLLSADQINFDKLAGYENAIERLNAAAEKQGPIYCEYSPSRQSRSGNVRKYFTEANAAKIDGVRSLIEEWYSTLLIGTKERDLLISDLISAANCVANIAGTYGCFLSRWTSASLSEIRIVPRAIPRSLPQHSVSNEDAFSFEDFADDVLYCDPPYTKRQYAAYYHLLETISLGDHPEVSGVSGIRAWGHKSSPFCYKRRALTAFEDLLKSKKSKRILISYSSEGHVDAEQLIALLSKFGDLRLHVLKSISRYAPNEVSRTRNRSVTEYVMDISR